MKTTYDPSRGFFLCFIGPAGAGKSFLARHLLSKYPSELAIAISATSRSPRPDEVDGKHYYFLSREDFMADVERGAFFEWEETHGNLYGTPQKWITRVLEEDKRVLLDVDVRGAVNFCSSFVNNFCGVLVLPPTVQALVDRIRDRGGVAEDELKVRLATAEREFLDYQEAIKDGVIQHVLVNDDKAQSSVEAEDIFNGKVKSLGESDLEAEYERLSCFLSQLKKGDYR